MIQVESLSKHFGPIQAVNDISFAVKRGEVLGFLGPNGAGKSTTMKIITGFLPPNSGTARICGFDVQNQPIEVKKRIGYLPEGAPLYADMTPLAFLKFAAGMRRISKSERWERIERVVELAQIEQVLGQPIDTLSKGFKRRVGLAQALLHDPDVLVLDEPTDGLDPNQKHEVRKLIEEMAPEKAIIISTHILEEVEAVCSRALIIARGRIVADGTPHELQARSNLHNAVTLRFTKPAASAAKAALKQLPNVSDVADNTAANATDGETVLTVYPKEGASIIGEVGDLVRKKGWRVEQIVTERGNLDDVFRDITGTA